MIWKVDEMNVLNRKIKYKKFWKTIQNIKFIKFWFPKTFY